MAYTRQTEDDVVLVLSHFYAGKVEIELSAEWQNID